MSVIWLCLNLIWKLVRASGSPHCVPGSVPSAFHALNQATLPGPLGGPWSPHRTEEDTALESRYKLQGSTGWMRDARHRDPHSPGDTRPRTSQAYLFRVPVWGLPSPSLRETFLLPPIPAPWEKPRREKGWVLCGTLPSLTHRLSQKVSATAPAHFRALRPDPACPTQPHVGAQAHRPENPPAALGWAEEKPPRPAHWRSKQGEASKGRNELNKPFSPAGWSTSSRSPPKSHPS